MMVFGEIVHRTPMEYLQSFRISCAKNLLTEETLSIGEIAQKCGFENIYYFSNTFKKHAGMSPTAYRKNFRI